MRHPVKLKPSPSSHSGHIAAQALPLERQHVYTWGMLLLLTLGSFALGSRLHGGALAAVVLLIALTKAGLVAAQFMGFREAGSAWRWLMALYLISLCGLLMFAFLPL